MIELFQTGPLTAIDERSGLPVMVHGMSYNDRASDPEGRIVALVSETDGMARLIPWVWLQLDFRWDKDKGWFVEGEEREGQSQSAPLKPRLVAAIQAVMGRDDFEAEALANDLLLAMEDA